MVSTLKIKVNGYRSALQFYYSWQAGESRSNVVETFLGHVKAGFSCRMMLRSYTTLYYLPPKDERPVTFQTNDGSFCFIGPETEIVIRWLEHVQGLIPADQVLTVGYW
jgi:hypothetical protein